MDTFPDSNLGKRKPDEPEPASEGKRETREIPLDDIDLTQYIETRYVSKNKNLKKILFPLVNKLGISENSLIGIIEPLIRSNNWRGFDSFCETHKGADNFWDILQCLFYLNYFAAEKIDFDQMQKAMGIQQARWSVDPANECYQELRNNYEKNGKRNDLEVLNFFLEKIKKFNYFNEIPPESQTIIVNEIFEEAIDNDLYFNNVTKQINTEIRDEIRNEIKSALKNRIFYNVGRNKSDSTFEWEFARKYLGIPQTYDLTSVTCFHKPTLIFGSIKPKTMVNFIIKHNMRPFAAHLPGSTSNLTVFDENHGNLVHNWRHDFDHQFENKNCNIVETINRANNICPSEGELPGEDAKSEEWLNNERFQKCLDSKRTIKNPGQSDYVAESFLDSADIFEKYQRKNYLLGGKKTKRRGNRKTRGKKQKRSRKQR